MLISIWTHWQGRAWNGEIPEPKDAASDEERLEYVFRWFNDVDPGDRERMLEVGYDLPSLSVGDVVRLREDERWRCAPFGWEKLEADEPTPTPADVLYGYGETNR
jgi:hypothetical protein